MSKTTLVAFAALCGVLVASAGTYDLVIYGSSPAALSAAVQAKRMGVRAVVVSPETRIGGLTTGGLGQTDIGNKSAFGGLALRFYRDVAAYYREEKNWKWQSRGDYLPDGQCAGSKDEDSMWTFEPSAALAILEGWERQEGLEIHRGRRLDRSVGKVKVEGEQRRIVSFVTEDGTEYRGKMFIDATYEGDLLAAAGCTYAVGREANDVYGETLNGVQTAQAKFHQLMEGVSPYVKPDDPKSGLLPNVEPYDPNLKDGQGDRRMQAYCFRMCLTDVPENRIPFAKPEGYDERDYELLFRHMEAKPADAFKGDLKWKLPWINSRMPNRKTDTNNRDGFSTDFIGRNWNWPEASYAEREAILAAHLKYQRGLMWTLANHPRVPQAVRDVVSQWGTCRDEFCDGLGDGWQRQLYVREGRRLVGDYVMTEANCVKRRVSPRPVAMAAYTMDSHHVRRYVGADGFVHNEGDVEVGCGRGPYGIDYGAIVPKRGECANLFVPVCLSASHIAFGSIRMEPVFFALGQAAATAAAQAIAADCAVQDLPYGPLAARLLADGQVIRSDPLSHPYTVVPIGIGMDAKTEDVAAMIRGIHARSGIDRFVLHAPGHGVRISGYFDEKGYRGVGRRVKAIQDAVAGEGVKVGFLMGPTMNVGIRHPWTKFVMQNGKERPFTACPGDPAFRKAFAAHCAAVAEECRPFLYMMEDDFRLFWDDSCHCARHKAKPRQASEDLVSLAQEAARAIHRISPETRIGLSVPGGYREMAVRIARALADGMKPFVRWYGTDYGFDVPMRLPDNIWTPLWAKQNISDGLECVYEADACPNTAFYGSGARLVAASSALLANGFDGLWYWIGGSLDSTYGFGAVPTPNLEAYVRGKDDLAAVARCGREGRPVGVVARTGGMGRLLARYGFPFRTAGEGVALYSGAESFVGRSKPEIEKILSGRILIDGDAAMALTKLGYADEIGVRASVRDGAVDFSEERVVADGSRIKSSFHSNYGLDDSPVRRLEIAGADEVSRYCGGRDGGRVQSAVTRHVNGRGGRIVVVAVCLDGCTATNMLNYRKRNLMLEQLEWLGDSELPVRMDMDVNVMLFANEDEAKSRLFVHATQLSSDPSSGLALVVAPPYRGGRVEVLRNGSWTPLAVDWQNSRVVIPASLRLYDSLAVRIGRVNE